MHLTKCCLAIVTISLVKVSGDLSDRQEQSVESSLNQNENSTPYWEYILREFVFKTISPPPPANNALYRRLLEAPFYSGPLPSLADQDSIILSRGDVFYLPNGRWILCQEGCTNCGVCAEQSNPTVKWTLRRLKRKSSLSTVRYDLQLTIVPQVDESYHMKNLWPRTYVYVTTLNDQEKRPLHDKSSDSFNPYSITGPGQLVSDENTHNILIDEEAGDGLFSSSKKNKKNSKISQTIEQDAENSAVGPELNFKDKIEEDSVDQTYLRRNIYDRRYRSRDKPSGHPGPLTLNQPLGLFNASDPIESDVDSTNPRVILGTDQLGQKHLVHIVPGDNKSANSTVESYGNDPVQMSVDDNNNNNDEIISANDKDEFTLKHPTYDKVVRKVLDSLNSHRLAIEKFFVSKNNDGNFVNNFSLNNLKLNELRKRDDSTFHLSTESYNNDMNDAERSTIVNDWRSLINRDNDNTGEKYKVPDSGNFRTEGKIIFEKEPLIGPDLLMESVNKDSDEILMTEPKEYDDNFQKLMTHQRYAFPPVISNWTDFRNSERGRITTSSNLMGRIMGYDHDNATDFLRDNKFVY
ncbi:uncharacterized protein LOC107265529 [Cephus cinctus]|uniref:Uncharacterized protein LOC107265529 n=1 Tax=Cephus cinctus TaxID=211228 RepID=A0AAJ7FGE7_CEPCN|nr:uncharacterized protein LOC107265529 [Cephus cinctus]